MRTYKASSVGGAAREILLNAQSASVMGVTSRGIFCISGDGRVFFLSYENWQGPLTINLNLEAESSVDWRYLPKEQRFPPTPFTLLSQGSKVNLTQDGIHFEDLKVTVLIAGAPIWKADLKRINHSVLAFARANLAKVAQAFLAGENHNGWHGLIPHWAGIDLESVADAILMDVDAEIERLAEGFRTADAPAILHCMSNLSGKGSGLTPSGDDFLMGLLLGLRATSGLSQNFKLIFQVSDTLLTQVRFNTTLLSAELISCALKGQADERLVSSLEGILWGSLEVEECARRLRDYGASSGGDALLGMSLAIRLAA